MPRTARAMFSLREFVYGLTAHQSIRPELSRLFATTLVSAMLASIAGAQSTSEPEAGSEPEAAESAAAPEPEGYWTGPVNGPVPATIQGGKVINAQDLSTLLD